MKNSFASVKDLQDELRKLSESLSFHNHMVDILNLRPLWIG